MIHTLFKKTTPHLFLPSLLTVILLISLPLSALASTAAEAAPGTLDFTASLYGYLGIAIFVLAYSLVPFENTIHLRKSKPVLLAAGLIWALLAFAYIEAGDHHTAHEAIKASLLEYGELFLFLLAAMTYINAMEERNVFQALRAFLVSRGFSLRTIFWITGLLAFIISPIADNLTTALLMGAVVMAVASDNKKFVAVACINVVIAANAGGAFSPFGDITTLMVWQKGLVEFHEFFDIFFPSLVNWIVPATVMSFTVEKTLPKKLEETVNLKYGALAIIAFFLITITTAVCFHNYLNLPPVAGMMLGLGFLGPLSYHIKLHEGSVDRFDYILGTRGPESIYPIATLVKNQSDLEKSIDMLYSPAFAVDKDHKVIHWNRACEKFTGVKAKKVIGTTDHWKPFYTSKQPMMADLVLNYMPEPIIDKHYSGHWRKNDFLPGAFEASRFISTLGRKGRWVSFTAAPIRDEEGEIIGAIQVLEDHTHQKSATEQFDLMKNIARAEWDTLLFFYGVILCVGGLAQFGYLNEVSQYLYHDLGPTTANVLVGILSAVVDNIPVMFAVLTMEPHMSHGQWLLVTLCAGVGGSMLSIGSAAGVALMGTARGAYTFGAHLKWTPIILLGYAASIVCHLFLNAHLMQEGPGRIVPELLLKLWPRYIEKGALITSTSPGQSLKPWTTLFFLKRGSHERGELLQDERFAARLGLTIVFEEMTEEHLSSVEKAIPSLAKVLNHDSALFRGEALGILGIIGTPEARRLISTMREDGSPQVQEMDRPGIIAEVTEALFSLDGDLGDINQSLLQGFLTMILAASFPDNIGPEQIRKKIQDNNSAKDYEVIVKPLPQQTSGEEQASQMNYVLTAQGKNKSGLVYGISSFCHKRNINILDLSTTLNDGLYTMMLQIDLAQVESIHGLRQELDAYAERDGLRIIMQHADIFKVTHEVSLI
ncbi:unnamed protein product [Cyprideis torosa]|uniref:Uncharacterized protein n=1 Tax=Cyprideis torosa TaxID=163714 RepID=A0A7R8ZPA9_9CRUS|nr:unnamed protein product [Cyprideis torosa]CAG0889451.1 unnamed protein product [Cyprideis torosa]